MTSRKDKFVAELEPLLIQSEAAIVAGDFEESRRLGFKLMRLCLAWSERLTPEEFKSALNNPTANAIIHRLSKRRWPDP
jgi:hypothetical protein